jgi:phosphoserine phosphatase
MNDELTVILNSVSESLETLDAEHPARPLLLDLEIAAKRCVLISSGLMHYSQRLSARVGPREFLNFLEG